MNRNPGSIDLDLDSRSNFQRPREQLIDLTFSKNKLDRAAIHIPPCAGLRKNLERIPQFLPLCCTTVLPDTRL